MKVKCLLLLTLISLQTQAGIVVGGTRFVFHEKQKTLSLRVKNTGGQAFLVRTTVAAPGGAAPFIATPPLLVLEGGHENAIRIIRTDDNLPATSESLFYVSIAAIPSGKPQPNSLQIAVRSRFKLFYRPQSLEVGARNAYRQIQWTQTRSGLRLENPTPYYLTLGWLSFNQKEITGPVMLAPFGLQEFDVCSAGAHCQIQWQSLDDNANLTPPQEVNYP